ncbi:MAG: hypothetical protein ACJAY2_003363 [Pseudomonadales bacterium]|jgi:hypothetical protein
MTGKSEFSKLKRSFRAGETPDISNDSPDEIPPIDHPEIPLEQPDESPSSPPAEVPPDRVPSELPKK